MGGGQCPTFFERITAMLDSFKQPMKYAKLGKKVTVYEKNPDGSIKYYQSDDGTLIPLIDKEVDSYSEPVSFRASITNKLAKTFEAAYGADPTATYCQLTTEKGRLPLDVGDIVWKQSEVVVDDDGLIDPNSADYTVKGVATEGLTVDLYMLQKNIKEN